jgi:stage V sporulation protein D (sporulation-specific penicillin-binding protein)
LIVVDEPTEGSKYGSVVAAPYVANVLESILPYLGCKAVYTEEEEKQLSLRVPSCEGWSAEMAQKILSESGFFYRFVGEGSFVTGQIPAAESKVLREGATVILTLGESAEEMVQLPNVTGMTAAVANKTLLNAGFNVRVIGAKDYLTGGKIVVEQLPAPETCLPRGTVVTIRFAYDEIAE